MKGLAYGGGCLRDRRKQFDAHLAAAEEPYRVPDHVGLLQAGRQASHGARAGHFPEDQLQHREQGVLEPAARRLPHVAEGKGTFVNELGRPETLVEDSPADVVIDLMINQCLDLGVPLDDVVNQVTKRVERRRSRTDATEDGDEQG